MAVDSTGTLRFFAPFSMAFASMELVAPEAQSTSTRFSSVGAAGAVCAAAEGCTFDAASEVAEKTFSSPATVSRTIKKCGISGFAELRYLLTQQAETEAKQDNIAVNEIFNKSLLEVSNTIDHLSIDTILTVVKEIRAAKRIYLLSRGLSEHVAQEFVLKLQILGFNVFENSDPASMQEMTRHIERQELVIIFSLSGKTPELLSAAENAASLGARIVTITCSDPDAPLARIAHAAVFGYKHHHVSITSVDATSRLPLYVISRILIDYLTKQLEEARTAAEKKKAAHRKAHYF